VNELNSKKKVTRAISIVLSLLFLVFILGHEFFWRYDPKLDITIQASLRDSRMIQRKLIIHEKSESPVDTTRREYKDIHHGITNIEAWLEGSHDTIRLVLSAKYISEARSLHISPDSSTQIILVPNTIQGLPSGSNSLLYLKNDSTLSLLEFMGFIADVDKDGNEEVNIPAEGGWVRLNTVTGSWIPAQLKTSRSTP
jgi:hypothetical protein